MEQNQTKCEKYREKKLDVRLACAAQMVREGAVLADIGTDHAYLPIALLQSGVISYAVAADIAEKPLDTARAHLKQYADSHPEWLDRITLVRTDGLDGLHHYTPRITDITICGMGGELIARILENAMPFCTDVSCSDSFPCRRFILQPMTMQPYLRMWLYSHGFVIETERLCQTANGKLYSVLCCRHSGESPRVPTHSAEDAAAFQGEAILGAQLIADPENHPLLYPYLKRKTASLARIVDGRRTAGTPCEAEAYAYILAQKLLAEMEIEPSI